MNSLCQHNPPRCCTEVGCEYTLDQCRRCWLYQHDANHRWQADEAKRPAPATKPMSEWPLYAKTIAIARKPDDAGLGDTVAHQFGMVGEMFKKVFKILTGKDCGCGNRQAALNQLYPYPKEAK